MKGIFAAALFAALFCAAAAKAATVTGAYYGTLTSSTDPTFPYLSVGDRFRVEFSYDTSVPDADPAADRGKYFGAISGNVSFSNGFGLSYSGGIAYVGNDEESSDSDYLNFGYQAALSSPGFPTDRYALGGILLSLIDFNRKALSSDGLPASYLSAALFDETQFAISFVGLGGPGAALSGALTSTPLPAALPLFAAALCCFGLVASRRRTNSKVAAPL